MVAIASKTKKIVSIQEEKQRISNLITTMADKALLFYTQLIEGKVFVGPLIEKKETRDLTSP
jgi:hypothetical protein